MALLLQHQMDITVGVFSSVRVPFGQKVKISQHHHNLSGANAKLPSMYLLYKVLWKDMTISNF